MATSPWRTGPRCVGWLEVGGGKTPSEYTPCTMYFTHSSHINFGHIGLEKCPNFQNPIFLIAWILEESKKNYSTNSSFNIFLVYLSLRVLPIHIFWLYICKLHTLFQSHYIPSCNLFCLPHVLSDSSMLLFLHIQAYHAIFPIFI